MYLLHSVHSLTLVFVVRLFMAPHFHVGLDLFLLNKLWHLPWNICFLFCICIVCNNKIKNTRTKYRKDLKMEKTSVCRSNNVLLPSLARGGACTSIENVLHGHKSGKKSAVCSVQRQKIFDLHHNLVQ